MQGGAGSTHRLRAVTRMVALPRLGGGWALYSQATAQPLTSNSSAQLTGEHVP